MRDVVIVDSVRTGLAKSFRGSFNMTRSDDLAAHLINTLLDRNPQIEPAMVEDIILGAASQAGEQSFNLARMAAVLSRLPIETTGTTVSRFCASGLQTIAMAANQIGSGYCDVLMAGGAESISMRQRQEVGVFERNPTLLENKPQIYMEMGQTAEVVADRYGVTREMQDVYGLQSQQRYAAAVESGAIADEIAPMTVKMKKVNRETNEESLHEVVVDKDECNRADTTAEGLALLKPAFREEGSVTAGNSSQLSDGASMALVMSADKAAELGLSPMGYFRGFVTAGCEPDEMGIGPVFAVPKLLKRAGLSIDDIDLWELNEAFASQCVYCRDTLGIDNDKYNVNGGSIAIGHPFGMTGARMVGHALRELKRRGGRYAVVTMCVATGEGAAGLLEAC
ncbi:MAG: thiolase family protein [Halieaceae bacterium]